jgi:hypothetical protein
MTTGHTGFGRMARPTRTAAQMTRKKKWLTAIFGRAVSRFEFMGKIQDKEPGIPMCTNRRTTYKVEVQQRALG